MATRQLARMDAPAHTRARTHTSVRQGTSASTLAHAHAHTGKMSGCEPQVRLLAAPTVSRCWRHCGSRCCRLPRPCTASSRAAASLIIGMVIHMSACRYICMYTATDSAAAEENRPQQVYAMHVCTHCHPWQHVVTCVRATGVVLRARRGRRRRRRRRGEGLKAPPSVLPVLSCCNRARDLPRWRICRCGSTPRRPARSK